MKTAIPNPVVLNKIIAVMRCNMLSAKEQMTDIIQAQPDDYTFDDILRELKFARMVERGLEDSRTSRTISNEEMKGTIRLWQK